jgi:hypothetical protein
MEDPIRVGIVGADASGQGWAPLSHLPALKMLPEYEIAAVCTAHADTAAAAATKYGVNRAFHEASMSTANGHSVRIWPKPKRWRKLRSEKVFAPWWAFRRAAIQRFAICVS